MGDLIHVIPLNDLRPHEEEGIACPCRPKVLEGGIVVHNSWDGREILEQAVDEIEHRKN